MTDTPMVQVTNLRKEFPGVKAVDGISFAVKPGICFGMLGPNGAGKTTTMEIMEGVQQASGGEVLYKGKPRDRLFKDQIGIQFQSTALPDFLTVREVLQLFQSYYPKKRDLEEIIGLCSLREYLDRDTRKLSGGQRQRLLLGLALVNDPELIFLDEPTTGLDPQSRRNFWELIERITGEHKTVVLSTHYMDEAYQLCDELIIMDHGAIIAQDTPDTLLKAHFKESVVQLPGQHRVHLEGYTIVERKEALEVHTADVNELLQKLLSQNVDLSQVQVKPRTLEDLFIKLTGKGLRG